MFKDNRTIKKRVEEKRKKKRTDFFIITVYNHWYSSTHTDRQCIDRQISVSWGMTAALFERETQREGKERERESSLKMGERESSLKKGEGERERESSLKKDKKKSSRPRINLNESENTTGQ